MLIALTWALALALNRSQVRVRGASMLPTLVDGDIVLRVPVWVAAPTAGTVVVALDPRTPDRTLVKRVAAVAGEQVEIDGATVDVPPDHVLLLGDHPAASTDGRVLGPTPLSDLRGTLVWSLLPWGRI